MRFGWMGWPLVAAACLVPARGGEETVFRPAEGSAEPAWQPLFGGIDYRLDVLALPRPLRIHQLRIDMKDESVSIFSTPGNGPAPGEVDSRRTATFLKEFDLEVAVNATGFHPITKEGGPVDVLGLSVSEGKVVSGADLPGGNPVFMVKAGAWPEILRAPFPPEAFSTAQTAVQGWYGPQGMLLDEGKVVTSKRDLHPRTAIGTAGKGRLVYLLVADGRQKGFSEGMTLVEMAEWMRRLGCNDAMNLDGGGSSTMVVKGPDGAPRILNSPSGGAQRSVANHLGVHAGPLPDRE